MQTSNNTAISDRLGCKKREERNNTKLNIMPKIMTINYQGEGMC